jgi:hypothetical protein
MMKYIGGVLGIFSLFLYFFWAFKHGIRTGIVMVLTLIYVFAFLFSGRYMNQLSDSTNFILLGVSMIGLVLLIILFVYVFNLDTKAKNADSKNSGRTTP